VHCWADLQSVHGFVAMTTYAYVSFAWFLSRCSMTLFVRRVVLVCRKIFVGGLSWQTTNGKSRDIVFVSYWPSQQAVQFTTRVIDGRCVMGPLYTSEQFSAHAAVVGPFQAPVRRAGNLYSNKPTCLAHTCLTWLPLLRVRHCDPNNSTSCNPICL